MEMQSKSTDQQIKPQPGDLDFAGGVKSLTAAVQGRYVPSEEALKFIAFIRAAGIEENISPEAHYKIADALFSSNKADWNVVIECLRGMGKSTILEYAFIYVAAIGYWPGFGKTPFIVFLGASQEGNVKAFYKNVAGKIFASDFLRSLFKLDSKNYRQTDSEIELTNTDGVLTISAGRGMSVNWRGIRSRTGARPTVLIADDILSNDIMTSETVRNTVETNWFNSALPALDSRKFKVVYIGTPLSEDDLMHKLKNSGEYLVIRFPLCSVFPCAEEDFDSIWLDRFSYEYATKLYNQFKSAGRAQSFYQEYMLEITDLTTLLVEEEDINWFDHSMLVKNRGQYNFYIVTDFATSTKRSADFTTIGVIAVSSNGDWLLADGICKRQTMQESLDDIFRLVSMWKPLAVGIETTGQQGGFISIIQDMMLQRNTWFQFGRRAGAKEIGIRPNKNKEHRFVTGVQPMFKQGKVWFPRPETVSTSFSNLLELLEEMTRELGRFTMAGGVKALAHDDAIDLLNQMSEMEVFAPSAGGGFDPSENNFSGPDYWGDREEEVDPNGSTIF